MALFKVHIAKRDLQQLLRVSFWNIIEGSGILITTELGRLETWYWMQKKTNQSSSSNTTAVLRFPTLASCLGFTTIMVNRLKEFFKNSNLLLDRQFGFDNLNSKHHTTITVRNIRCLSAEIATAFVCLIVSCTKYKLQTGVFCLLILLFSQQQTVWILFRIFM